MSIKSGTSYAADREYEGNKETNSTNVSINEDNNKANRELAEYQNQWNLEQWNRENQYNSPANQLRLLRQAGMNPLFVDSKLSQAQQLSSADLANQQAIQIDNPAKGQGQLAVGADANKVAAVTNALNQISSTAQNLSSNAASIYATNMQYETNKAAQGIQGRLVDSQIQAQRYNNLRALADTKKTLGDDKRADSLLPYQAEALDAQSKQQYAAADNSNINTEVIKQSFGALVAKPAAEVKEILSRIRVNLADSRNKEWDAGIKENYGFDPKSSSLLQAIATMAATNPTGASSCIDNIIQTIDNSGHKFFGEEEFEKMKQDIGNIINNPISTLIGGAKSFDIGTGGIIR